MSDKTKYKKVFVTTYTVKNAGKTMSSKSGSSKVAASGKFVSRDEIKAAFKSASQKLKSA